MQNRKNICFFLFEKENKDKRERIDANWEQKENIRTEKEIRYFCVIIFLRLLRIFKETFINNNGIFIFYFV